MGSQRLGQAEQVFGEGLEKEAILDRVEKARRLVYEAGVALAEYRSSEVEHPGTDRYNVHLAQAGENLWTAYQFMLEEKKGEDITEEKGFDAIQEWSKQFSRGDPQFKRLYNTVKNLHILHYEGLGNTQYKSNREVVNDILLAGRLLNQELRK